MVAEPDHRRVVVLARLRRRVSARTLLARRAVAESWGARRLAIGRSVGRALVRRAVRRLRRVGQVDSCGA